MSVEAFENKSRDFKAKEQKKSYPYSVLTSELLFTLLPFAVLFLVYVHQKKGIESYLIAPEWAFASAILFGQTIVKFVQGMIKSESIYPQIVAERVGLLISIIIIVGLVPSMVILAIVLVSGSTEIWLGYTQIGLFFFAVFAFLFFGVLAHSSEAEALVEKEKKSNNSPKPTPIRTDFTSKDSGGAA